MSPKTSLLFEVYISANGYGPSVIHMVLNIIWGSIFRISKKTTHNPYRGPSEDSEVYLYCLREYSSWLPGYVTRQISACAF